VGGTDTLSPSPAISNTQTDGINHHDVLMKFFSSLKKKAGTKPSGM